MTLRLFSVLFRKSMQILLDFIIFFAILITLSHDSKLEQLWRSRLVGRGRMIGNHVNGKTVSRVRIPPSPPQPQNLGTQGFGVSFYLFYPSLNPLS